MTCIFCNLRGVTNNDYGNMCSSRCYNASIGIKLCLSKRFCIYKDAVTGVPKEAQDNEKYCSLECQEKFISRRLRLRMNRTE